MTKKGLYMLSVVAVLPGMYGLLLRPCMQKKECGEDAYLSSFSIFLVLRVVLHGLS